MVHLCAGRRCHALLGRAPASRLCRQPDCGPFLPVRLDGRRALPPAPRHGHCQHLWHARARGNHRRGCARRAGRPGRAWALPELLRQRRGHSPGPPADGCGRRDGRLPALRPPEHGQCAEGAARAARRHCGHGGHDGHCDWPAPARRDARGRQYLRGQRQPLPVGGAASRPGRRGRAPADGRRAHLAAVRVSPSPASRATWRPGRV